MYLIIMVAGRNAAYTVYMIIKLLLCIIIIIRIALSSRVILGVWLKLHTSCEISVYLSGGMP